MRRYYIKTELFKTILPRLVSLLMIINGIVNIVVAFLPLFHLHEATKSLSEYSNLVELVPSEQANAVLTIIIGLILILLGVGLYRRSRVAWRWAVFMLALLVIGSIYPNLKQQTLLLSAISLLILILFHKVFNVRSGGIKLPTVIAWLSVLFALAYGAVGSYLLRAQFHNLHTFIDAVYYTFVTYSTIGYGDITPATPNAKLFVVTMVVIGVGAFATAVTVLIGPLMERRLRRIFRVVERFSHMSEHTVLCGYNLLTQQIAKQLQRRNITCLFIEPDKANATMAEQAGFEVLHGDASLQNTLQKASLNNCHYIICADEDDATNILITMTAKAALTKRKRKHPPKILTKIENPENIDKAKQVGADEVISPVVLGTDQVLSLVRA